MTRNLQFRVIALVLAFVLQIAFWTYSIFNHLRILDEGESFLIPVTLYDPYDQFRGSYLQLEVDDDNYRQVVRNFEYITFITDEDSKVIEIKGYEKPVGVGIKASEFDVSRFYMEEISAKQVEEVIRSSFANSTELFLEVKILNRKYAIKDLWLNDIPVNEFLNYHEY